MMAPLILYISALVLGLCDGFARFKRTDIDLQTCIDNFDIHRDKIIRTQDSQSMGAKYLNEIDLGTRAECLRLCCETDNCDVFVFEEKNSGSCYLFHCGPPEDFKCKFTHHVNYSSAVLAVNRHLPDLESQIKLTKHEQDLTKLRKPEEVPTTPPPSSTTKSQEVLPVDVPSKPLPSAEARKCSRYQFECRSTGECIAIYNACDGIPQCADGSDEAPELSCPDSSTTPPPPPPAPHTNNAAPPARYDPNIPATRIHPLQPALPQQDPYRGAPEAPPLPRQEPEFIRPLPGPHGAHMPFDPQSPPYGSGPVTNDWVPHQSNQMSPTYPDKNSHIFNHKENGIQVPDGQEISQMQYGEQYGPKIPNYYDNYRQPLRQDNWPSPAGEDVQQFNRYPQEPPKDWHQDIAPPSEVHQDLPYRTAPPDHPFGPSIENPKHEQDKMAHELKHSKENMDHGSEAKIKIEKHSKHAQVYPDVVVYKMDGAAAELPDGVAGTPGGAVLSLTLGLIITCIMALLIGCRLRVKRRLRKGGKSYAHDADYLVNGMYL